MHADLGDNEWPGTGELAAEHAAHYGLPFETVRNVPKTIQIRDLDDDVYAALVRRAAEEGITVPELLRTEAARLAARPTVREWLARTRRRGDGVSRDEVLDALDELRGRWPNAGR